MQDQPNLATTPAPDTTQYLTTQPSGPEPEGCAVLDIGDSGAGKSYKLYSLVESGLELFCFGTEARFMESIQDGMSDHKQPMSKLHWCKVLPASMPWATLIEQATNIGKNSYETLSKQKPTFFDKEQYMQFADIYRKLSNYIDEKDGKSYGPVDTWGPKYALAFDGISGAALMSLDLITGPKSVRHEGEWGVAMDNLERLLIALVSKTKCFVAVTGHVDREPDPLGGGMLAMVGTLGKKLSPKIARHFSEVVLSYREGANYWWSTATPFYVLKKRSLPLSDKINPHYGPIVQTWHKRLAARGGQS